MRDILLSALIPDWSGGRQLLIFIWCPTDPDWFLSSKGKDTSTCGRNVSAACRTLDRLLDNFFKTSFWTNKTLSLVIDTSLSQQRPGGEYEYLPPANEVGPGPGLSSPGLQTWEPMASPPSLLVKSAGHHWSPTIETCSLEEPPPPPNTHGTDIWWPLKHEWLAITEQPISYVDVHSGGSRISQRGCQPRRWGQKPITLTICSQ